MSAPAGCVLAVDVGGTGMKGAVVDTAGRVVRDRGRATPAAEGPGAVVAAIRELARQLTGPDVAAAGVVVPGSVDVSAGVARYSANLGWRDVPLRALLAGDLEVPVVLEHDVRAAGLAEATLGAARGVADYLVLVIGTGIAGVVRAAGATVRGASDLAGEIGHVPVHPDGERCACGQLGCLKTYASAAAIARRYRALRPDAGMPDARRVAAAAADDPAAALVWREATEALGIALAGYTLVLDPDVIVLGGGLAEAGERLLAPVRTVLGERLRWRPAPRLERSCLGPAAGRLGAAIGAWQAVGGVDFSRWDVRR